MDGETYTPSGSPSTAVKNRLNGNPNGVNNTSPTYYNKEETKGWPLLLNLNDAHFMRWKTEDVLGVTRVHPVLCAFALAMLSFMFVEYTLYMIPYTSEPFDVGFVVTRPLNRLLAQNAGLNTLLAGLNTVYVGMQTMYILWAWLVEGRPRATISALFMFTCRGILGYSTQLPLPKEFLGSGADFPVGNVSFFLFYSGHVAASVIASLDMRRVKRWKLARFFDILNILQAMRLLSTRGHYTIDLAVGVGAGILFDSLAGKYEENKRKAAKLSVGNGSGATKNIFEGKNWSMSKNSSF